MHDTVDTYRATRELPLQDLEDEIDMALALGGMLVLALLQNGLEVVMLDVDGTDEVAIVPADRAWALLAVQFLHRLLREPDADNTVTLTYNMCVEGFPDLSVPGKYAVVG